MAPHHSKIENSYLDLAGIRRIIHDIHQPALVVGAGQGLIVAELLRQGIQCDGVDLSSEMVRFAKVRRGLDLVQADACTMPFGKGTYRTIIYATGVIDFMMDEERIQVILQEARRVAADPANIFVAFYRLSAATEDLMIKLGLLDNHVLCLKETLEIYRLNPGSGIRVGGQKGQSQFLARRDLVASLVGLFLVAGKTQRVSHAENIRAAEYWRSLDQGGPGKAALPE